MLQSFIQRGMLSSFRHHARYSTSITSTEYLKYSDECINNLLENFYKLEETHFKDIQGYDCEYSNGVITLKMGTSGTYVINKQPPNKQIWVSSPISGPARYDYIKSRNNWYYKDHNENLYEKLSIELSQMISKNINLHQ